MRAVPAAAFAALALLAEVAGAQLVSLPVDGRNGSPEVAIQVGVNADTPDLVARKVIAARNGYYYATDSDVRDLAGAQLKARGVTLYDFQRVEVTGVNSSDDTDLTHPGMFDKQLKMSYTHDFEPKTPLKRAAAKVFRPLLDLFPALDDTRGEVTKRNREILEELRGKRVNELFTHSWGSVAVYTAILNGDILPPKRLIVVGVPEANEEKWRALARYTDTEVHVLAFAPDKLKNGGAAAEFLLGEIPRDREGLDALWREKCARGPTACADPRTFDTRKFEHNVSIPRPSYLKDDRVLDHGRMLYYEYLKHRNLFNTTISELETSQGLVIDEERDRIFGQAVERAQGLIQQARDIQRGRELSRSLVAPRAPTASSPPIPHQPVFVAPRAPERPALSAPFVEPARAELVCRMVDAACMGDWSRAHFESYQGLTGDDLNRLRDVANRVAPGCSRSLLERLVAMRWSGAPLDLSRLQSEAAAFAPSSGPIFQDDGPARNGRGIPSRVPDRLDGPAMRELRGLPR